LKESGRGLILRYYPGICLERLLKTTKNSVSTNIAGLKGENLNPRPPEYEAEKLTIRPRCSVQLKSTATHHIHYLRNYIIYANKTESLNNLWLSHFNFMHRG
jgi:hypothetical protein